LPSSFAGYSLFAIQQVGAESEADLSERVAVQDAAIAEKNRELKLRSSEKGNKTELLIAWHNYEAQFASLTSEREPAVVENQEKTRQMKVRCGAAITQEAEKAERAIGGLKQR
jgi:hypothetical protein